MLGHHTHEFGIDMICNGCEVMLSDYVRSLGRQLDEARGLADFLRDSVGECHIMLSRGAPTFTVREDWQPGDLPPRLRTMMQKYDFIYERGERFRALLERNHACATLQPDGTCQGCEVSEALGLNE